MLLQGKVCLITGVSAASGIGYATAELFAAHGARLAILDVQLDDARIAEIAGRISESAGREVEVQGHRCDLTDNAACVATVRSVVERFGRLDVLVHSAGIVQTRATLDMTSGEFEKMIDVNLSGTFNINQPALRQMAEQGGGSIVNVASVAAQRGGGLVGGSHYAASKGGMVSFTKSIAREYGGRGVRANVICPALIETPMLSTVTAAQAEQLIKTIPLGRLGKPAEMASACLFLASELSSFVTGTTLDVNGGLHIH
jgi:NAD(P)-dependent dehydrogenase (short-subunit alcohol dehydrogenase family)